MGLGSSVPVALPGLIMHVVRTGKAERIFFKLRKALLDKFDYILIIWLPYLWLRRNPQNGL